MPGQWLMQGATVQLYDVNNVLSSTYINVGGVTLTTRFGPNQCATGALYLFDTIIGPVPTPPLTGAATLAQGSLDSTGLMDTIPTEIVALSLTGAGPLTVTLQPSPDSLGKVTELNNNTDGDLEFPVDSFFDVFVNIDLNGTVLHNIAPIRIQALIASP